MSERRHVVFNLTAFRGWGWDPVGVSWTMPWWRRWWLLLTCRAKRYHATDGTPVIVYKPSRREILAKEASDGR